MASFKIKFIYIALFITCTVHGMKRAIVDNLLIRPEKHTSKAPVSLPWHPMKEGIDCTSTKNYIDNLYNPCTKTLSTIPNCQKNHDFHNVTIDSLYKLDPCICSLHEDDQIYSICHRCLTIITVAQMRKKTFKYPY